MSITDSKKIIPIQTTQYPTVSSVALSNDTHVKLSEMFVAVQKSPTESRKQKNLTEVAIHHETIRSNRVALIVMPEWSTISPPYGIARMAALSKHAGFATKTWDINAVCKKQASPELRPYWSSYEDWKWQEPHYSKILHPMLESMLIPYIDEILSWQPTVLGFSCWYTNDACTMWMIEQFKHRSPDLKIIIGGPNITQMNNNDGVGSDGSRADNPAIDHYVSGEGELLWLQVLENIEHPTEQLPKFLTQSKDARIDLDSMPPADYSDFNISLYDSRGITSEFSRGCIANCVYCNETVFWKYRARQGSRVLEEIEIAYRNQRIQSVTFIDSLLNGNLRELRAFAEGLMERNIRISWSGYSRIDGKMDRDFWALLKQSGASGFAFGVESGSQRVLDLMKKNCRVEWIEQNFNDMAEIDFCNQFATWFTGFPGEELTDVAQTQTLMWRLRNSGMGAQSAGTCGLGHNTPLDLERERFGVRRIGWSHGWATQDLRNTVFHRFVRFKLTNILLEQFRLHGTKRKYQPHCQEPDLKNQYQIESDPANWADLIPWEKDFDYEIIKVDINPLANSLINEIWPLLRVFWLAMGAYRFRVEFDPDRDLKEFGTRRYPKYPDHPESVTKFEFRAVYNFEIDDHGVWNADFDISLQAEPYDDNPSAEHHGEGRLLNFDFKWVHTDTWSRPMVVLDNK
jgi:hypothetical protein